MKSVKPAYLILAILAIHMTACSSQFSNTTGAFGEFKEPLLVASTDDSINTVSEEENSLDPEESDWDDEEDIDWDDEDELDWDDEEENMYTMPDPLEGFNRAMFLVNDKLIIWVLKPVSEVYNAVLPPPARVGIKNFFYNLAAPVRIVNNILQGKPQVVEAEIARFLYNTTVGVLGFGNPARHHPGLDPDAEDLGQTLGHYGIGDGFYLYLPVFGPSSLRDSAGMVGDWLINPLSEVEPVELRWGLAGFEGFNTVSFRIADYETLKKVALDPYEATRNLYIQLRQSKIKN